MLFAVDQGAGKNIILRHINDCVIRSSGFYRPRFAGYGPTDRLFAGCDMAAHDS